MLIQESDFNKDPVNTRFFEIARAYLPEMRLLFRNGKLVAKDGWDNVSAHCILQALVSKQLGTWLKLPVDQINSLIQVALIHDWEKRIEREPSAFSEAEIAVGKSSFEQLQVRPELIAATGVSFVTKYSRGEQASLLEKLQFYIDDICMGRTISTLDARIDEVSLRRSDLNEDAALTSLLNGKKYWDMEREFAHTIELEIFLELKKQGIDIACQEDIPTLLHKAIVSL